MMKKPSARFHLAIFAITCLCATSVFAQNKSDRDRQNEIARNAAQEFAAARDNAKQTQPNPALDRTGAVVELTLDDAVMRALERNTDIAIERLNPEVQDLNLARLASVYRPTVSSQIGQQSRTQTPTSTLNGGSIVTNDTTTYNSGVSQAVPWGGGSYTFQFNNNKAVTNSSITNFNPAFNTNFLAAFTQPLLRGFTIDANRQQIRVTAISRDISQVQLRGTIATTVANVRNAYWELLYSVQALDVAKSSLALAQRLVADNQARVEVGTMAPLDVVQAQAEAATRRQAVAQADATLKTDEIALKRMIVSGTDDPLWRASITPVDRPTFSPQPPDVEGAVRTALSQRTDLEAARKTVQSNDITLAYLHNQELPGVDLTASYGAAGIGGTQFLRADPRNVSSPISGQIVGGYTDALSSLRALTYPNWNVALNFSYQLGRSAVEANFARAKVQRNQATAQLRALELSVATDVTNSALLVTSGAEQYDAARVARELAEQRLSAEQSRFEVGLSTNFLVVQAQRDLATAQNSELRALLSYRQALVNFERVQSAPAVRGGNTVQAIGAAGGATTVVTTGN
jgi:outer membrane protein